MSRFDATKKKPEIIARNPTSGRVLRPSVQEFPRTKVWTKFWAFWSWKKGKAGFPYLTAPGDENPPLSNDELLSIYQKLQKSCDAGETELKDAIGYGQRIIAGQKISVGETPYPQGASQRVRLKADSINSEVKPSSTHQRR